MDPEAVNERRWLILGILCLSLVLVVVGNTALNVALPTLVRKLDASATDLQWITDAYGLVFAGLLLPAGALGDRFGRKGALQFGLTVVGLASLASTFAATPGQLIATRALMGVGAAFVMPATLSILANVFPPQERAKAIAIWAGFAGAGGAIGPIISGVLLNHFWWGSVFLVNVPIAIVALAAGYVLLPTSKDPNHGRLDPVGALISMVGLGALLYAIIEAPTNGWTSPITFGGFLVFVAAVTGFIVWENRNTHPMLPMEFFRNRRFSVGASTVTLTFFVMFGLFFILTLYLQFVQGYSALTAGLATLPLAVMMVIVAPRSAGFVDRWGQHRVQAVGLALSAVGLLVLSTLTPSSAYIVIAVGLMLLGTGVACTTAPATNAIIGAVPLAKSGVGSAVNDTTREVGGALGIAVLGSVMSSVYRSHMASQLVGLPPDVVAMAGESIGGAFGAAAQSPPEVAGRLVQTSSLAYTDGMRVALLLAAGVAVLAGIMVYFLFPREPSPDWGDPPADHRQDAVPGHAPSPSGSASTATSGPVVDLGAPSSAATDVGDIGGPAHRST